MHRKECDVEAHEQNPEADPPDALAHHASGEFRKPDAADHRKHVDAEQHVMQMRDHEVRVGELPVAGHGGGQHADEQARND